MNSQNASSGIATTDTAENPTAVDAYVGRFAPSPSGPLHTGSLFAALISYLDARRAGGSWMVRIEDIDPPRTVPGSAERILRTLEAHGLHWDGDVRYQSKSASRFLEVCEQLIADGFAFYCDCARRMLAATGHGARYPGTCRDRGLSQGALRVRVGDEPLVVPDRWTSPIEARLDLEPGDFVIRRRDGLFAYQLAVVVDDADQGITHVVRGNDLRDSTPRQVWLQRCTGLPMPAYAHFPILVGSDGRKLGKQTHAAPVNDATPGSNLELALTHAAMPPPRELSGAPARELLDWASACFQPERLARLPSELPA